MGGRDAPDGSFFLEFVNVETELPAELTHIEFRDVRLLSVVRRQNDGPPAWQFDLEVRAAAAWRFYFVAHPREDARDIPETHLGNHGNADRILMRQFGLAHGDLEVGVDRARERRV